MKYLPLLTLPALLVSLCLKAQNSLSPTLMPSRQIGQPGMITGPLDGHSGQKRTTDKSYTLVLSTNPPRGENTVRLPQNLDSTSLVVSSGGAPLTAGKDYVFLVDLNSLRILNQQVLTSEDRLYMSYKFLF